MDLYHIWFDARDGVRDLDLARAVGLWLGHLKDQGLIADWRLTRRKLGLGPPGLGDWHVVVEVTDLAQLDRAFALAATRAGEAETLHHGINGLVHRTTFALYRDFPDPMRQTGAERF